MSDRPIASLLSGGLDSSLVAALLSAELRKVGNQLHTFSIGFKGSPDLEYAQLVATHIGSHHHPIELEESDFLQVIPDVVRAIQSWDITSVRASVGNYLLGKYIKANTDFTVIFNGDVSEEINASYRYSKFAPNPEAFFMDNVRLIQEVHQYDVLRSARCMEHHSLEPRTPFADRTLVQFVMSIDPGLKMFAPGYQPMEKYLLRLAFENTDLLPEKVLWRPKEAFSDGVSKTERSWYVVIQEWMDAQVSDEEFSEGKVKYAYHCPPSTKEAYFYRKCFEEILPGQAKMITDYWMPRFVEGITDPSARELHADSGRVPRQKC